ncbi:hypothetical protein BAE44_0003449 [Dichanthelium oligosanthes]|uniref:Negatively light-regulated protein n=1 Tax=Dichanthelium oligosanthes TaxID=888268 RepID=A0A1E5WDR0_9POAL|nr:hypothetical protein BAE44_0003449 [Dichanthelium oligosanthes]
MAGCDGAKSSASMEEEACVEKKYGGIAPKKPLISKDHERAYFDSADWVLGKQAANSSTRAVVESLKPKLKLNKLMRFPQYTTYHYIGLLLAMSRERLTTSSPLASRPALPAETHGLALRLLEGVLGDRKESAELG